LNLAQEKGNKKKYGPATLKGMIDELLDKIGVEENQTYINKKIREMTGTDHKVLRQYTAELVKEGKLNEKSSGKHSAKVFIKRK
jgi:predicted transcriptional regulator